MSLNEFEDLPIVMVSAMDANAAETVITKITEKEETCTNAGCVWQLENKYYTARVRLLPVPDPEPDPVAAAAPAGSVVKPEAHVIYLTDAECASGVVLERRAGAAGAGEVRLAVCECERPPPALEAAAARCRYELVPLQHPPGTPPPPPAETFPELCGWERAREALHAHTWPGLRTRKIEGRSKARRTQAEADEEAGAVERAEQFAEALAALATARELPADARRGQADALLAAFTRALGLHDQLDLDQL